MVVNVELKDPMPADTRDFAERRLSRLGRHANLHDVHLIVRRDQRMVPPASAEIVVHLHHTRIAATCRAATVREAIDGAIDRADEQVRRRQDRVAEHKGQTAANALPPRP